MTPAMGILYGVTDPVGGTTLNPAGYITVEVSVPGAALGMPVNATPQTYPGGDMSCCFWEAWVCEPDTVTVRIFSVPGGFIAKTVYFVSVDTTAVGTQTPWTSDVDAGGFSLSNAKTVTAVPGDESTPGLVITGPNAGIELQRNDGGPTTTISYTSGETIDVHVAFRSNGVFGSYEFGLTTCSMSIAFGQTSFVNYPGTDPMYLFDTFLPATGPQALLAVKNFGVTQFAVNADGSITAPNLPSTEPPPGSKQIWYDPSDGNRVKFAA